MFAWQATVQDEAGNIVPLPVVTVWESDGTTLASIYNEAGVALPNPLTGTMEGFVQFWAAAGEYKIEGAKGGQLTAKWEVTLGNLDFRDPAEFFTSRNITAAMIGQRVSARTGEVWDVVGAGEGDFDHAIGGVGVKVVPSSGIWLASAFGILGDNATDNTSRYAIAVTAIENGGGGYLRFGDGQFRGTLYPRPAGYSRLRGVIGVRGRTRLLAFEDLGWAVIARRNVGETLIFDGVTFLGESLSGAGRRCNGVWYEIRADFVNCEVRNCLIGIAREDAYYGVWRDCRVILNDVGMFAGTRPSATATINDLRDAAGNSLSVTLPLPTNQFGHSGNFALDNCHFQGNRIGLALLPTSQECQFVSLYKTTMEAHGLAAIVASRSSVYLDGCWFEANNDGGSAVPFDMASVKGGSVVLVGAQYVTPSASGSDYGHEIVTFVECRGGRIGGMVTDSRGMITLEDGAALSAAVAGNGRIDTSAGGAVFGGHVRGDGSTAGTAVFKAAMPALRRGRGLLSRSPHRTNMIYGAQPENGKVWVATRFNAASPSLGSSRVAPYYGAIGAYAFEVSDGVWPDQKCIEISGSEVGPTLGTIPAGIYSPGKYIFRSFTVKASDDATVTISQAIVASNTINLRAGEWTTITYIDVTDDAATSRPAGIIRVIGPDSSFKLRMSSAQVIVFDDYGSCLRHALNDSFYTQQY